MQGSQNKDPQCKHAEGPLPSGAIPADWAPCLCKSSQPLLFDPSALTRHHLPKPDGRSGHTIRGLIRQWLHDKSPLNVSFLKCHEDINKYVALLSRAQQLSSPWGRSLDQQRSPPAEGHAGKSWTYFISMVFVCSLQSQDTDGKRTVEQQAESYTQIFLLLNDILKHKNKLHFPFCTDLCYS